MAQMLLDLVYSLGNCLNCFPGSPTLKINSRSFKILRLLGEGGFSYVYLVQDTATAELFALKKIRCPFGAESVQQAMREVEAYKTFAHVPGIIHAVDYSVAQDRSDADAKTVYVLLPYYRRGNLQDIINANLVNHTRFPERELMHLFLGVCRALKAMHQYRGPPRGERMEPGNPKAGEEDDVDGRNANNNNKNNNNNNNNNRRNRAVAATDADDETEQARPLMIDEEVVAPGERRSYAHRDIKPGMYGPLIFPYSLKETPPFPSHTHILTDYTHAHRQHHDSGQRLGADPDGPGLGGGVAPGHHVAVARDRDAGHGGRAQHDAVPGAGAVRRQDGVGRRARGRRLVAGLHPLRLPRRQVALRGPQRRDRRQPQHVRPRRRLALPRRGPAAPPEYHRWRGDDE